MGLSFGAFRTTLVFAGRGNGPLGAGLFPLEEMALGASYERRLSKKVTLQLSGGGIGYARVGGPGNDVLKGFFGGAGLSWSVRDEKGFLPFVMVGASLSGSLAIPDRGGDDALYALDIRGSVTAGYTFWKRFTPYAVGRLFGGPVAHVVSRQTFTGTDLYHFQLGAGFVVGLPWDFDLSAELIPLGEQRVSLGVGRSF